MPKTAQTGTAGVNLDDALSVLYKAMSDEKNVEKVIGGNSVNMEKSDPDGDGDAEGDDDNDGDGGAEVENDNMAKGGGAESEEDEGEDEEEGEDGEGEGEGDDITKSFGEDDLVKAIDASPVLSRLTDSIDDAFNGMQDVFAKSMQLQETAQAKQNEVNTAVAQGLAHVVTTLDTLAKSLADLTANVDAIAGRPAPRKAATHQSQVLQKSVGDTQPQGGDSLGLSPAQIQDKLIKGVRAGLATMDDVARFDRTVRTPGGPQVSEAVLQKIKDL